MTKVADVSLDNRRVHPRRAARALAKVFPSGLECVIVDETPRGMRLRLSQPTRLPDGFILVEWETGDAHDAHAVWETGLEVGIQIQRSCDLRDRTPHAFAEARAAWTQDVAGEGEPWETAIAADDGSERA